jgi:small redox-active disulfide protein 2
MEIKLLGRGCKTCERLEKDLLFAINDLHMNEEIKKITQIDDILSYGVMSTPALVINNDVIFAGRLPSRKALKEILLKAKERQQ